MKLYRSRYGATWAPDLDALDGSQHHWPDAVTVVEVGPRTAAALHTHELFSEVAPHEVGLGDDGAASPAPAPHTTSTALPGTPTTLDDREAAVSPHGNHEQAPAEVTETVTEPSPVTAATEDDPADETPEKRPAAARRRRRVSE